MNHKPWRNLLSRVDLLKVHESLVVALVFLLAEPTTASLIIGAGVSVLGQALRLWVAGYDVPRDRFSVHGPYRFVRHPYHLGTFFLLLGACIASRSSFVTILMLAGTLLIFRRIFVEEEALAAKLGGTRFKDYKMHVSSFLPNLASYPEIGTGQAPYSLWVALQAGRRRELDTSIALVVGYLALYAVAEMPQTPYIQGVIGTILILIFVARYWFRAARRQSGAKA